jgi:hypothetical protein
VDAGAGTGEAPLRDRPVADDERALVGADDGDRLHVASKEVSGAAKWRVGAITRANP